MIIVNNPNNPSGIPISTEISQSIAEFARKRNIILFSDEVYRPLFHDGIEGNPNLPKPGLALGYDRTVVSGSMSKAFALAGIRLGWIASKDKSIIEAVAAARDYTTISVSQLDDQIASYALGPAVLEPLIQRNITLARTNLRILAAFVDRHKDICTWIKPNAGTTAFIQFSKQGKPVEDKNFCIDVLEKTKVLLVPGSHCFGGGRDFKGYVRMGYVCETNVLKEALDRLSIYVENTLT